MLVFAQYSVPKASETNGQLSSLNEPASLDLDRSTTAITLAVTVLLPLLVTCIAGSLHGAEKIPVVNPPGRFETAIQKGLEVHDGPATGPGPRSAAPIVDLVASVSLRVFLGDKLCRNEVWIDITKAFTHTSMAHIIDPARFPQLAEAITPYIRISSGHSTDATRTRSSPSRKSGAGSGPSTRSKGSASVYNDVIECAETEAGDSPFDMVAFQLAISLAAIHTTSDLLSQAILLLSISPDIVDALRKEMVVALPVKSWKKTSLTSLRLVDSAIRGAQRVKPTSVEPLVTANTPVLADSLPPTDFKVVLCHLILKYDWKLAEGSSTDFICFGTELISNTGAKVLYRSRKEEFDLDALAKDEEVF
ncbi:hypothetical protein PspLS_11830 [Pyricularia sp. CBS 133598]|nr:hypothetical protein PspLS_11830 [Pyricularia sp. CBS 133598]